MITLPSWRDWLFSAKAFTAAMLALYIALMLGLPRPYWAMATVYIVSHPLTGATRSKALYRACGTLIGAVAAVVFVPLFVNAPVLLSLVVSLWMGTLLYLSLLDRTPRSYVFMLAAYSLLIIGLPSVFHPELVFDTAVARSEEILLGIVCASVVAGLVFPSKVTPVLSARLHTWLRDASTWAAESLAPQRAADRGPASRHRLAADILALDQLISQLSYDADSAQIVRHARELRGRMSMLLPILSSLSANVAALRQLPQGVPVELPRQMAEIADWMCSHDRDGSRAEAERLLAELASPAEVAGLGWAELVVAHARARLRSLIYLWQDCLSLQRMIADGEAGTGWQPAYSRWEVGGKNRHYDYGMMVFSAGVASLGTFLASLVWIGLGWDDGVSGVILGGVACCFFASLDEPAPLIKTFFVWTCVSVLLSAVMLFVIIPAAHEFETLVAMMALPFLCIGVLIPQPRFNMAAMLLGVNTATFLGLQGAYDADFLGFMNGNIAGVVGVLFALVWVMLTRPFGADLAMRRLVHSSWRALARMAAGRHHGDYATLTALMLDRLSLLMPLLAASGHDKLTDGFAELRVGFSTLDLQRDEHRLAEPAQSLVQQVLQAVAAHYQRCADERRPLAAPAQLAVDIDAAIHATVAGEYNAATREALNALVELRVTLFPAAEQPAAAANPLDPAPSLGASQ